MTYAWMWVLMVTMPSGHIEYSEPVKTLAECQELKPISPSKPTSCQRVLVGKK